MQTRWEEYRRRLKALMLEGKTKAEAHLIALPEHEARIARRKLEIQIEKERAAAQAKTCQICGRPIFAESGVIAHHGYQRPGDGWQTASCPGARELPYEVSRERLGWYVGILYDTQMRHVLDLSKIQTETVSIRVEWEENELPNRFRKVTKSTVVTRETFDEVMRMFPNCAAQLKKRTYEFPYVANFDKVKADAIKHTEQQIKYFADAHREQAQRWYDWKQTHQWNTIEKFWVRT